MFASSWRAGRSFRSASGFVVLMVGASGCAEETTTIRLRDPHDVGVSLRTATGSIPVIEPGSNRRVMDPVPGESRRYPEAHVSRDARGKIAFCCSSDNGPNLADDPVVFSNNVLWPSHPTLHTGDALRMPFDYTDGARRRRARIASFEMVTPWSNVISVHDSRRFDRGQAVGLMIVGAVSGGLGALLVEPESKSFGAPVVGVGFAAVGSVALISGLIMLLTPPAETEWRAGDR